MTDKRNAPRREKPRSRQREVPLSPPVDKAVGDVETALELFRNVFTESPIGIVVYDAESRLLDANPACLDIFGVASVDDVRGLKLFDDPNLSKEAKAALRRGERMSYETLFDFEKGKAAGVYPTSRSGVMYLSLVLTPLGAKTDGGIKGYLAQVQEVTRRHRAEAAEKSLVEEVNREKEEISNLSNTLQAEHDLLDTIMENTRAHLAYLDADFKFVKVNSTYATGSGHSVEELIGKNHFDLFPNAENQAIFKKARDTGKPVEFRARPFEFVDQPERGVTHWDWTLIPVKGARGRVQGLVLSLVDVTDRVRAEQAARGSEKKYRQLVESLQEGVWAIDEEGFTTFVNPRMAEMLGYRVEEMMGKHVRVFLNEEDATSVLQHLELRKKGMSEHRDLALLRRDGSVVQVGMEASPLFDDEGKHVGALAGVVDITHERTIQEDLRKSEENFRLLTENATDGIYRFRLEPPGYEYVSPAMTSLFGYEREEWLADPDLDHKIVHPDDQQLIDRMRMPENTLIGPVILRCHRRDGTPLWIEHHNAPIRDPDGKIVAIQGIVRDVTERVQSMEEMEKLRNEFLGMVTHELKTPLAAIKGSAATALGSARPLDVEETRELFDIINEQSDRLRDLVDNLLDMSRIEAGSLSVKPEPLDLASVMEEAQGIFARSGRSQRIDLEMPDQMPPVNADRRRLVQVLTNLLTNAAKFSSTTAPIRISVEHDSLLATVKVKDEGQGIAPDKLPLLFQKFSQVHDGAKTRAAGTGLGLAICKGIVEAHGGRIWAESAGEGKGATFIFTLPLAGEPVPAPAAAPRPTTTAGVRRSERPRVLAVDDELPVLRYLQHSLDEAGYQCIVTSDPAQVTKFVELERPDLILLDLRLPGISGFDLLARIREFSPAPVIFLTASDSSDDTVRALKLGADDYVTKPFAPSELLARIEAALRRRSLPGTSETRPPFKVKDLEVNFAERRVLLEGKEISLSATEYKLLYELATHSGLVLTFDQILQRVWGAEYAGETELVRSFIRNLRRKLNDDAKQPRYILTERQIGYRMVKE
jgi:PAS domain S-box-containing protein